MTEYVADDQLNDYPNPEAGESADAYRQRVARMGAEYARGAKQARDQESGDRRYASKMGYKGTVYSSDQSRKASKYSADKNYEGNVYQADVSERNNKRQTGNDFLGTYAKLLETPANYFAASNFLRNGVANGYGNFVNDASATVPTIGTFHPYTGPFPGNAAQALFHQGGEPEPMPTAPYPLIPGTEPDVWIPNNTWLSNNPANDQVVPDRTPYIVTNIDWQPNQVLGEPMPRSVPWVGPGPSYFIGGDREPVSPGNPGPPAQGGGNSRRSRTPYVSGGTESTDPADMQARRNLYVSGLDERFGNVYRKNDVATSALADWRRESGREGPDLNDPTDRANFERYVEDWRGVHVPTSAPAPKPRPVFSPSNQPYFGDDSGRFTMPKRTGLFPYSQGGDSQVTEEGGTAPSFRDGDMQTANDGSRWRFDGASLTWSQVSPPTQLGRTMGVVDESRNDLNPEEARPYPQRGRILIAPPETAAPYVGMPEGGMTTRVVPGAYRLDHERLPDQGGDDDLDVARPSQVPYTTHLQTVRGKDANGQFGVYTYESPADQSETAKPYPQSPNAGRPGWHPVRHIAKDQYGMFMYETWEPDGDPYAQGGEADWMQGADDSWASPEDQQRLKDMDNQFRPGVQKWRAGYWAGLSDDDKDLWRSYWGYRGLSPRSVEHQVDATRAGNYDAFGAGRLA